MTTTELRELIAKARSPDLFPIAPLISGLADALEKTLARLEAAEKVCEAVENMRGVSLDLKTALGLEHKVHEALDAWREAKSS